MMKTESLADEMERTHDDAEVRRARIRRAAPDLLAACKVALETLYATRERWSNAWTNEDEECQSETENTILAAIARATGE